MLVTKITDINRVIPCQMNQKSNFFPLHVSDFFYIFTRCSSTILKVNWKVLGLKSKNFPRYQPPKSSGVDTILVVNSRHDNFCHFQNDITLDPEQIETWGFHCSVQNIVFYLVIIKRLFCLIERVIYIASKVTTFFLRYHFRPCLVPHNFYRLCSSVKQFLWFCSYTVVV